jgi:hypothetical protein
MKLSVALCALIMAGVMAMPAQAAPPEGKGPGQSAGNSGKGNGKPGKGHSAVQGDQGNANPGKGNKSTAGTSKAERGASQQYSADRHDYDDRGRHYEYLDGRRHRGGDSTGLIYADITVSLAREYAMDYGLSGYSSLPPGIRKNLARGKPLPPGIAKKMVPGSMLGRLPRYDGYEWRIAGTDLILIAVATAVVADILYDVFD